MHVIVRSFAAFSLAALASAACAACGGEVPGPAARAAMRPDPDRTLDVDAPPSASATASGAPLASLEADVDAPWSGTPWDASSPDGVRPLDDAERDELGGRCKPFADAIAGTRKRRGAPGDPARLGVAEAVLEVLADPPAVPGVDVKRCAALLSRDTIDFVARSRESQAVVAMKTILAGLDRARASRGSLCTSAPAVPANLAILQKGPYESDRSEWTAEGWRCVGFDPLGAPQRHQLELRTKGDRYRIVARVFAVTGASPSTLYVEGVASAKGIDLAAPVMRRSGP